MDAGPSRRPHTVQVWAQGRPLDGKASVEVSIENHAPRANIQDRGQPCATVRVDKCLSTEGAKAYYLWVGPFFPGRVDWEIICALASGGSRTMNFFTHVDLTDEHLDILTCSIHAWCLNRQADPEGHLARAATTLALEVISACPSITSAELRDVLLARIPDHSIAEWRGTSGSVMRRKMSTA